MGWGQRSLKTGSLESLDDVLGFLVEADEFDGDA